MSKTNKSWTEEVKISGENLIAEIEKLLHEGNVNHIVVKNPEGHTLVEFPITIGVIGLVLVPILAAVAAIATYAADFTVVVTRVEPPPVV